MPLGVFNLSWYDHNAQRAYPLLNDSGMTDSTGSFRLPMDVIVGLTLSMYSTAGFDAGGFFISSIAFDSTGFKAEISFESQTVNIVVARFWAPREGHTRNKSYRVYGSDQFPSISGTVVIGNLEALDDQPPGQWTFQPDDCRIDPDCIIFHPLCVESLAIENNEGVSERLSGPLTIVFGSNMQGVPVLGQGTPQLRIDAIASVGFSEPCVCAGGFTDAPCVRTINGVAAVNGNIDLLGSGCSKVSPVAGGIQLDSSCCKPCCGCPELEVITDALQQLENERQIWITFVQNLGVQVQSFSMNVLGARLGDRGCINC